MGKNRPPKISQKKGMAEKVPKEKIRGEKSWI